MNKFLKLFIEKFQLVDESNYFLEGHMNVAGINLAIANQRDAISHFITFLKNPIIESRGNSDTQLWEAQYESAEEHLRRAILEPYQLAISIVKTDVDSLLSEYISNFAAYDAEPLSITDINSELNIIQDLYSSGRAKKTENIWNENWEEGVKELVEAFFKIRDLNQRLEERNSEIRAQRASKLEIRRKILWIFLALVAGVLLGLASSYLFFK